MWCRRSVGKPARYVISSTRLPSHGRQTAFYLKKQKKCATPFILVGGAGEALKKTKAKIPEAIYTTETELPNVLRRVANNEVAVRPDSGKRTTKKRSLRRS